MTQFRSAAETDTRSAAAHWGLARAYDNLGQFNETLEELRQTVDLDVTNLEAKARLGNFFLLSEPPLIPESVKIRDEILTKDPKSIEGHLLSASILMAQRRPDIEIENTVNKAISLDPKRVESYLSLARLYMSRYRGAEAEAAIQRGIDADPASPVGYMEYARYFAYASRNPEAEAQYQKAIEVAPTDIAARDALAGFYAVSRQYEKGEAAYKQLIEFRDNSPASRLELAEFYLRQDHRDEAVNTLRETLSETPEYVRARYLLGQIYLDRKDAAGVNEQLEALLKIDDQDAGALKLRSRFKIQKNKANEAADDLAQILSIYPSDKEALFLLAQVRISLGQIDQSRVVIDDLEKYHPTYFRTDLLKIQAAFSEGDSETALKLSNLLIEKTTPSGAYVRADAQELRDLWLRALSSRGLAHLEQGKLPEAKVDLEEVVRLSPRSADALVNLAKVLVKESDLTAALQTYENALALDSGNFDALNGFININIQLKQTQKAHLKTDEWLAANAERNDLLAALHYLKSNIFTAEKNLAAAEKELLRAIDADDNYLPAYSGYANLLVGQNRSDEAIAQFKRVVEKKPAGQVYTMLGILSDGLSRYDEAERYYRKALEIAPGTPIAANNLAWLLAENNGNLDEALQLATSAATKNPEIAGYHDTLGQVYLKKRLFSSAIDQFKKAVSLDESNHGRKGSGPAPDYRARLGIAMAAAADRAGARNKDVSTQN